MVDASPPLAKYRLLGNSGLRVSPLCLGAMSFGSNWSSWMGEMSKETAFKILDAFVEKGGNFIDTANKYHEGQSEEWIGEWLLTRGNRDDMVIASKFSLPMKKGVINSGGNHRKSMMAAIDASLKRLRTHYIDIYYVHFWDFTTTVEELMRGLDDIVRSGKVHYIAISDAPAWQVSRANMLASLRGWSQFVAYQGKYHLGEREMERELYPMAVELGMGVIPWGVLGQGKFTGKYKKGEDPKDAHRKGVVMSDKDFEIAEEVCKIAEEVGHTESQVTLNWALQQPNTIPLIGVRTVDQLLDNLGALEFALSEDHIDRLNAVSSFELGFPHNIIGTSYQTCPWLKDSGTII